MVFPFKSSAPEGCRAGVKHDRGLSQPAPDSHVPGEESAYFPDRTGGAAGGFYLSNRGFAKKTAAGRIYPEGAGSEGQPIQPDLHYRKRAESGGREPEYLSEN